MKKWVAVFLVLAFACMTGAALAEEDYSPGVNHAGTLGKQTRNWRLVGMDKAQMPEITAPSGNPPANFGWLYVKDNAGASALYFENDAGSVTQVGSSSTAWDDLTSPDANKTHTFTTFTSIFSGTSTAADQWTFRGTGNFGDVSVVKIESLTGNPTDGTVLEVVSHDTDADALVVQANSATRVQVYGSGNVDIVGLTGVINYTDFDVDADGKVTIASDDGGSLITLSPSAAAVGIDASNATLTNAIDVGANTIAGTTAVIDFTNFDVTAAGNLSAVDGTFTGNVSVTGTFQQDSITAATAATTLTVDGTGVGGVTVGGTSTGTVTLGGGATLVNLPSTVDLTLSGGDLTVTDTANADMVTFTNNTMTTADLLVLSASGTRTSDNVIEIADGATTGSTIGITANAMTSGDGVSYTNSGAALTGSAFAAYVTDGAGFTGYYFRGYDGAADDFSVKRYGATTIAGNAATNVLTVTAGDVQIDAGRIEIDNTGDVVNRIARNNAAGTGAVLEIEQTDAGGGIALLIDQKNTTAAEYAIDIVSAGATQIHFTANGAAGDGMLYDATNAWTGQAFKVDAGPWVGTLGEGAALDFRSDSAGTSEAGSAIYVKMQGTGVDAAAIDGKGLYIEDEAAATAGSYLVKLDTLANTALHISNSGAAADGIKIDVANSYTGQGFLADLGPWLGTSGEGFISLASDNAATIPAGQFMRFRQLGTGQHAAAIGGTLVFLEDDATAPAAGTSYAMYIDATNIEAIHVDTGKVLVDETVTATGGLSSGTAADSTIFTDTVECNNACIKGLRAAPKELVAAPAGDYFIELVSAVLILDYGSEVLTETADNLVIEYNTSGTDITGAIEATGFIDAAADTMAMVLPAGIATVASANTVARAIQLFNTGGDEYAGNASNDTALTIKVNYRVHKAGL